MVFFTATIKCIVITGIARAGCSPLYQLACCVSAGPKKPASSISLPWLDVKTSLDFGWHAAAIFSEFVQCHIVIVSSFVEVASGFVVYKVS